MVNPGGTYLIGVDGGGSRCRAALADARLKVLATAERGAANVSTDFDAAIGVIAAAIEDVRGAAGGSPVRVHLGLAGVLDEEMAARVAGALPLPDVTVSDDRATSVAGALGGGDGAVAAVGTGSFAARRAGGVTRFVGGWGFQLGDQASGAWLGRELLAAVLLAQEGLGPESGLTRATLVEFGGRPAEIVRFAQTSAPSDYARFAPRVVSAAAEGDAVALGLMRRGAAYLETALDALGHAPGEPLCLIGGLGAHYAPYLSAARAAAITEPAGDALTGALRLAAERGEAR